MKPQINVVVSGAPDTIRTCDLRLRRQHRADDASDVPRLDALEPVYAAPERGHRTSFHVDSGHPNRNKSGTANHDALEVLAALSALRATNKIPQEERKARGVSADVGSQPDKRATTGLTPATSAPAKRDVDCGATDVAAFFERVA